MTDTKPTFNIFGPVTKKEIRVGYISTDRGYIQQVDLCEANRYEKNNPGTTFIYENRDKVLYLDIDGVNALTVDDLTPSKTASDGSCDGLQLESPCTNKTVANFYGGGGVGVLGNPIIGTDGAVLAVDIIEGGFGYQYPPIVEVKNGCDIGDGSLFESVISDDGYTINTVKYYDECPGIESNLELCDETPVEKAGWGRMFNQEGVDIGPWDPTKYTDNILADPIDLEMDAYKKQLAEFKNPFWTSREPTGLTITSGDKVTRLKYDVYHWAWGAKPKVNPKGEIDNLYIKLLGRRGEPSGIEYWENDKVYGTSLDKLEVGFKLQPEWKQVCEGECKPVMPDVTYLSGQYYEYDQENFMNKYAVSPLPMSNVLGSDGKGDSYSMEWDIDFPYDGNYTFIAQCDNEGTLFVDGEKQSEYNIGAGGAAGNTLSPPTKKLLNLTKGNHAVRFDIVNLVSKKKIVKPAEEGSKTNDVDFKITTSTLHGATASIEDLDIYVEKKYGSDYVPPKDFNRKVEYGRVYDVVLTSNTFRTAKVGSTNKITYVGLKRPGDKRWSNPTRLEYDDNSPNGFDVNGSFTIDKVTGGTAKFNKSGESIDFTGKNVNVTLTYTWKDNPNIAGKALDQIKMGNVTWTQGIVSENPIQYVKPDGTLTISNGKQNPWIKSHPSTNWVSNSNVAFLRSHAVFPVHDGTQNDKYHKGIWYLDIKTGGNYTVEVQSDDTASIDWDSNRVADTRWKDQRVRSFSIPNVPVGKHKLAATVRNNARYGSAWYNNPGGVAWKLKDPSGTVIATSLDPFNDSGYPVRAAQGSETHTIILGGVSELGSDESANIALRTKGERVLQMEDIPHVGIEDQKILFDDVIMTASQGRFFNIQGNKAKYTLPAPLPVDRSSSNGTGDDLKVFDTLSFIDKAARKLWKTNNLSPQARKDSANSFSNRYGITPFNPTIQHDSNYPGVHTIVWPNVKFPVTAEYDITIAVDDNVRLKIGDQVNINKQGFAFGDDATTYSSFAAAGAAVGQGKFRSTGATVYRKKVKEGTYTLTAELEQIPGGKYGMSANAMLLAVDIRSIGSVETEVEKKSWNQNPFAVALSIESPPPPPPVREIPDSADDGSCPENPIWSTMTAGASQSWYPADYKSWSEFTNKYAISPVPPIDMPGSDGVGVLYKTSWKMTAPYAGDYLLKGTVEDTGKLFVNGKEITALASPTEICPKISSTKVYLEEGIHTIDVEVENKKDYETPKFFIDQKIFNTQDWQNQISRPSGRTKDIDFKIATSTLHGATASIESLGIYHEKKFGGEYDPPKDFKRTVEYGRIYDVVLTSDTFRTITSGSGQITYVGMRLPENKRRSSDTRLEFDDNPKNGFDVNGSFTIDNVVGGTAKFNQTGNNIDITGKNVKVTLTYAWNDNPKIAGKALDQIKIGTTTWTQTDTVEIPPHTKQNPWIKSYQNDTNWASNSNVAFLRSHAVFPVHDGTQNDKYHKGTWYLDIKTGGNYTLEVQSDDTAKMEWDSNLVANTKWKDQKVGSFTIVNVPVGKHQLSATVRNNARYGANWYNNPGGVAWRLKDSSGAVVATSLDPFNDPTPSSGKAAGSETHTITLGVSTDLGNDMTSGIELRTKGDKVLQMEDIPHVPIEDQKILFDDVIMTVSEGKFFGINGNKAKYVLPELHNTKLDRGGVTYKGPALYNYKFKGYGKFLNKNGVTPDYPKFGGGELVNYEWSNVDFPQDGEYDFHFAHDAHGSLYMDGEEIIRGDFDKVAGVSAQDSANWNPGIKRKIKVSKGKHTITIAPSDGRIGQTEGWADGLFKKISSDYYRGQQAFDNNPSAMALGITIKTETKPELGSKEELLQRGKSWKENPTGISAIMIPPPCPKKIKGKGVVVDVIVDDPGGPYPTDDDTDEVSYPVALKLKKVIPEGGINYDPGSNPTVFPPYTPDGTGIPNDGSGDQIIIDPPNGAKLTPVFGPHGVPVKINVENPGGYWTEYPSIRMPSATGIGVVFKPQFEIVRDPLDVSPDKLLQVTDLVGLKQTGYVDGRAYYGTVFFDNDIKYAGMYETIGQKIRVYDTLQDSIDAMDRSEPSAIQRSGTDVSSNDPRLDIPNTPDNLI